MDPEEKKAFLEHFADLEDPRIREPLHSLEEILLVAVCAVLSGAALWGRAKLPWLRQFLPFENGTASHDTCGRVFALLDAAVSGSASSPGCPRCAARSGGWRSPSTARRRGARGPRAARRSTWFRRSRTG